MHSFLKHRIIFLKPICSYFRLRTIMWSNKDTTVLIISLNSPLCYSPYEFAVWIRPWGLQTSIIRKMFGTIYEEPLHSELPSKNPLEIKCVFVRMGFIAQTVTDTLINSMRAHCYACTAVDVGHTPYLTDAISR